MEAQRFRVHCRSIILPGEETPFPEVQGIQMCTAQQRPQKGQNPEKSIFSDELIFVKSLEQFLAYSKCSITVILITSSSSTQSTLTSPYSMPQFSHL